MEFTDFVIGATFWTDDGAFRCTDIGPRAWSPSRSVCTPSARFPASVPGQVKRRASYHAKYYAYELTRGCPPDSDDRLASALVEI